MAFTFNATPKDASANSYATVEFADDYFGGDLHATEWAALGGSGADLLKKQQALAKACRRLERLDFKGVPTTLTQVLKWPRSAVENPDAGSFYDYDTVPARVREAQCELAISYLRTNPASLVTDSLRQFKRLKVEGAIDMEMRDGAPDAEELPEAVSGILSPFLSAGSARVTRLVRA